MTNHLDPRIKKLSAYDRKWLCEFRSIVLSDIESTQFSVGQIAFNLSISDRHIYRKTKQLIGISPNKYIKIIKMEHALICIKEGRFSTVQELSYAVGYKRSDYFAKIFKKHHGFRPLDALRSPVIHN